MALEITETITDIDEALGMVTATGPVDVVDDMGTVDEADDETLWVNPNAFFGGLVDFRALLPLTGESEFTDFPDTTLGGLLPENLNGVDPLGMNEDKDGNGIPDMLEDPNFYDALIVGKTFGFNDPMNDWIYKTLSFTGSGDGTGSFDGSAMGTWVIDDDGKLVLSFSDESTILTIRLEDAWDDEGGAGFEGESVDNNGNHSWLHFSLESNSPPE
jgi:hypothetical protein